MPDITPQSVEDPALQELMDELVVVAREDREVVKAQKAIRLRRRGIYERIFQGWPDLPGLVTAVARAAGVTVPAVIQVRDAIEADAQQVDEPPTEPADTPSEYAGTGGEQ